MSKLQDFAKGLSCPQCLKSGTLACLTVEMKGLARSAPNSASAEREI